MRPSHTICNDAQFLDHVRGPGISSRPRPPAFDIALCSRSLARSNEQTSERFAVSPHAVGDTVGDLATAAGFSSSDRCTVDGRPVGHDRLLIDTGFVHGSRVVIGSVSHSGVDADEPAVPAANGANAIVHITVDSGPGCTGKVPLAAGRHVIGRSPGADIKITDGQLGLHHAVVVVDHDAVTLTQLCGQAPIRIDGEPVTGTQTVGIPARVSIGMNELQITPIPRSDPRPAAVAAGSIVAAPNDPWRRIVRRSRAREMVPAGDPITPPDPLELQRVPPATALIGAAVGVLGAGVIAMVLGQMMFALFAAFGAVASAATWSVGALSAWRRNRRSRRAVDADRQRFLDELAVARITARERHLATHADLGQVLALADALTAPLPMRSDVWQRRLTPPGDAGGAGGAGGGGAGGARGGGTGGAVEGAVVFRPVIGTGTSRWSPALVGEVGPDSAAALDCAATLDDVPIPVALACGSVTAVSGARTERAALLRSILCQLAVRHGPADWQLVVVSAAPGTWAWTGWFPHTATSTGTVLIADATDPENLAAVLALADGPTPRPTLLVVDDPALFAVRTGALRRFVERAQPATLTTIDVGAPAPAVCDAIIEIGSTGAVMTTRLDGHIADTASSVRMSGLSADRAALVARALAPLIDPEMLGASEARLGRTIALSNVDDVASMAGGDDVGRRAAVSTVCRRWSDAGADPAPRVVLGESADGVVEIDLVADGPHALIAGTTGSGKSELLRSLVIGLALRLSPEHLTFVLVDYKGGSTFDRCADLPHTVGLVTDLDAGLAERALVSLGAELHRREQMLREVGAVDLADYRAHSDALVLPRLVVVIDEFAALAKELPDFLAALVGVAQRGRSLGVHLILATQRPAGVVSDDIRANTNLRLALRLNDSADAVDVVGDATPSEFARDVPGRAVLRLGPDELVVFQAARCSGPARTGAASMRVVPAGTSSSEHTVDDLSAGDARTELDVAAAVVRAAFQRLPIDPPHRPWIDALPEHLSAATVDLLAGSAGHDGVGVIDDPAAQCRSILRWQRELGNLALVGALGSGTTTAMRSVIAARCRERSAAIEHWYLIDARGDAELDELSSLDHVGAVVRVQEQERVFRILARLVDEIDRRCGAPLPNRAISLAIDGLSPLRAALSSVEHAATLALFERLLNEGPAVGLAVCWTDDPAGALRSTTAAETWVFRCEDPGVARSLGATIAGPTTPGHLTVVSCGRRAVVAIDAGSLPPNLGGRSMLGPIAAGSAPPVTALPSHLSPAMLPAPAMCRRSDRGFEIDVGVRYDDLQEATLRVPFGDHVFIGGATSTGKTTALRHVVLAWRAAHPEGSIIEVDRRRPLSAAPGELAGARPVLIAVDDAERVDDANGVLAALVAAAPPQVLIVAAGRLEAVRSAYGHWTRDVARSRCGLILTAPGDVDGDLLGVTLPRRAPVPTRPGLAWLIDGAGHRLVQLVDVEAGQPLEESPSSQRGPVPY